MVEGREAKQERNTKRSLLVTSCIILAIGTAGGPLVMRLYYIHGGKRVWLSSLIEAAGFPIILLPLSVSYIIRRRRQTAAATTKPQMVTMKLPLFLASSILGVLCGINAYLYSYGVAWLPVSTCSLILSTQLVFTAIFAFFMVRQKFTAFSMNAVVLLTIGQGVLAMHASGDRPADESSKQYVLGFVVTLLAATLNGLLLPLVELVYKKTKQVITFSLVLEIQLVMSLSSALFSIVAMIINDDFKVIPREARDFGLGKANYYILLVGTAIIWQFNILGSIGIIFCSSSLLSGIMATLIIPITEVLAVIFYKEKFQAEKGISLVLSIWGFISYFYGEFKKAQKMKRNSTPEAELPQNDSIPIP